MDIFGSLQTLKRHSVLFVCVFFGVLLALILAPTAPQGEATFLSEAKVLLTPEGQQAAQAYGSNNFTRQQSSSVQAWFADENTISELVNSEELLRRVADRLGSSYHWESLKGAFVLTPASSSSSGSSYRLNDRVNIFYVNGTGKTPEEAQKLTNTFLDEFVNYIQDLSAREHANTRRFLEELMGEAQEKIQSTEQQLMEARQAHIISFAGTREADARETYDRKSLLYTRKRDFEGNIATLHREIGTINQYLDGENSITPWDILERMDPSVSRLKDAVSQEELRLVQLRRIFTDESRKVQDQVSTLDRVRSLLDRQVSLQVSSLLQRKLIGLEEQRNKLAVVNNELNRIAQAEMTPEELRSYTILQRQLSMWEDNHLSLIKQHYQARVVEQASRRQGAMSILQNASYGNPVDSFVPKSFINKVVHALPFCLLFALCATFLWDYLGATMQIRPRVEEALDCPVIGVIPTVPLDLSHNWEQVKQGTNLLEQEQEEQALVEA